MRGFGILIVVVGWGLASVVFGQEPAPVDSMSVDTVTVPDSARTVDTLMFEPSDILQGTVPVTDSADLERQMYQRPMVALAKSMAIPGWGQFGNRKYVKAAVFLGLDAWLVTNALKYGDEAADYRDQWEQATDTTLRNELYFLYKDKKESRNKYTWFAVIVTVISMFDAYVDAHLSGYPLTNDDTAFDFNMGSDGGNGLTAWVSYRF